MLLTLEAFKLANGIYAKPFRSSHIAVSPKGHSDLPADHVSRVA